MTLAIGVDVGGTKVAAGVVDCNDGSVVAQIGRDTPSSDVDATADTIAEVVRELSVQAPAGTRVGIGAAGWIDRTGERVLFAPNLAWRDEPLKARVERRIGSPVLVDNDANTAAWAEHRFGAARGARHAVLVTVGTGIGGGIVVSGALYRGGSGTAAEFGHVRVVPNGRRCGCGNRGCWEQYCSGKALEREARDLASGAPLAARRILELAGGGVSDIRGRHVTQAAGEGDRGALDCLSEVGRWLGQGLADITAVMDPEVFVVGGGVAAAGSMLLDPARDVFANSVPGRGYRPLPDILPAELGNDAGFIGAADLSLVSWR